MKTLVKILSIVIIGFVATTAQATIGDVTVMDNVNGGGGFTVSAMTYYGSAGYSGDLHFETTPTWNAANAQYAFTNLENGTYQVSFGTKYAANGTTGAQFAITVAAGTTEVLLDQSVAPDDFVYDGANFEIVLPAINVTDGTLTVEMTDTIAGSYYLYADAIHLEQVVPRPIVIVIDNVNGGGGGFTESAMSYSSVGYRGDLHFETTPTWNYANAQYAFTNLYNGTYQVSYGSYSAENGTTGAQFAITVAAGTTEVLLDQSVAPDDFVYNSDNFEILLPFVNVTDGTLTVEMTDTIAGSYYLYADAIHLEPVVPVPVSSTMVLLGIGGLFAVLVKR